MAKYLDQTGLKYFWGKIKGFVNSHEHPVGSVYITISSKFNPADQWGGTWSKIAEGQCLIQAGSTYTLGSTGGESTHTLTVSEIPSHDHGLHYFHNVRNFQSGGDFTSLISNGDMNYNTLTTGGGKAHNNLPPYLAVNIWKRTA